MDNRLKKAIKKTLAYGKKFGVGYGIEDIKIKLISNRIYGDKDIEAGYKEIRHIKKENGNNKILEIKIEKAKKLVKLLENKLRDILLIGITGSVAAGYPKEKSDIDLMIITRPNRLWINRILVREIIKKNKIPHRQWGQKEEKDQFCFNLWMEEGSLSIPRERRNLNNAMDLIMMKPLLNKGEIYKKFLKENNWVEEYVATGYKKMVNRKYKNDKGRRIDNILMEIINTAAYWIQLWYMRKKIGNGLVEKKRAFFHPSLR